jgi:hypothetical protein
VRLSGHPRRGPAVPVWCASRGSAALVAGLDLQRNQNTRLTLFVQVNGMPIGPLD